MMNESTHENATGGVGLHVEQSIAGNYGDWTYFREQCIQGVIKKSIERYKEALELGGLKSYSNLKTLYIGPAFHDNLGDNLLVLGSLHVLKWLNISVSMFCADSQTTRFVDFCSDEKLLSTCQPGKCFIYYHPGGNWGNIWGNKIQSYREHVIELGSHRGITTISGPQTAYYLEGKPEKNLFDKRVNSSHAVLLWRQHDSFLLGRTLFHSLTSLEVPDAVFNLGVLTPYFRYEYDVAIHLRTDRESLLKYNKQMSPDSLCGDFRKLNYSCIVVSWHHPQFVKPNFKEGKMVYLTSVLNQARAISSLGKVTITDRLHGTIVPYLSQRAVIFLESTSKKSSGVLQTALGDINVTFAENVSDVRNCYSGDYALIAATPNRKDVIMKVLELLKSWQ